MNSPDDLWEVHSMNRRTFVGMVAVGAAGTFFRGAPPLLRRCPRLATSSSCTGCSPTGHPGPR